MHVTYIALDPRKPGRFQSPFCTFLFQPAYVGKGNVSRSQGINQVLADEEAKPHSGELLNSWCKKMRSLQITEVPIVRLEADNEDHAFDMEGVLTHHFGIIPEGGILWNGRHGGMGGWDMSERTKKILSELNSGENNPRWGSKWTEEQRNKWLETWESKDRTRTPESMQNAWAAYRKKYLIITPIGYQYETDNLKNWCIEHAVPLSALRNALKKDGIVRSGSKKKSKIEGWSISYLKS